MKKLAALASMAALLCASTSFAKKSMDEEEMELVTAAGQPAVIIVADVDGGGLSGNITVNADEMGLITQTIDTGSQTNLRALALNNVAGENQVANGVNIQSGAASTDGGKQINEITQSWGATFDWSAVEGTATAAPGGSGGSVSVSAGGINNVKINCVAVNAIACAAADVANGGDGGDGGSARTASFPLSAYADKIIGVVGVSGNGATVNVSQMNATTVTQSVLENSQTTLAALALNNVAGLNQVANGFNLTSRGTTVVGNSAGTPIIVVDSLSPGTTYGGEQRNTINQFRGTPYSRPCNCDLIPLATAAAAQ